MLGEVSAPPFQGARSRHAGAGGAARPGARRGFLAGPALGRWYPDLANSVLVAVTEKRTHDDIVGLAEAIEKELAG